MVVTLLGSTAARVRGRTARVWPRTPGKGPSRALSRRIVQGQDSADEQLPCSELRTGAVRKHEGFNRCCRGEANEV
jgi:hypothetical protein